MMLRSALLKCRQYVLKRQMIYYSSFVKSNNKAGMRVVGLGLGTGVACAITWYHYQRYSNNIAACKDIEENACVLAGQVKKELPEFSLEQVSKHLTAESGIWVTYGDGVYDITDFIDAHPGGREKLMLAAGKSLEPYWGLYPVHNNKHVHSIIEECRIGNVALKDRCKIKNIKSKDSFINDPVRSPDLVVLMKKPFDAETPMTLLSNSFHTPNELFHVRNHFAVPQVEPQDFALEISGDGIKTVKLTLDELKSNFTEYTVSATIQCAGNRRSDLTKIKRCATCTDDSGGHIGNAEWTGVRLHDVLVYAGLSEADEYTPLQHVHLQGCDSDPLTGERYAVSIPIHKAMDRRGDCILAYQMNGEELPRDHGYPLRAVVPGTTGARSVKWLSRIIASAKENSGSWQQVYYKGFSPSADWNEVDFSSAPAIQEMPVQSLICSPEEGSSLSANTFTVSGVAWSGGGRGIIRVDVSCDGGKTWQSADLLDGSDQAYGRAWAWTTWSTKVKLPSKGKIELCCKAVDTSYNVQPDTSAPIWNAGGYLCNAWHRVFVNVK